MRVLLLVSLVPMTICAQDLAGQRVRSPLPQLRPELRLATLSAHEHWIGVSAPSSTSPQSRDYRWEGLAVGCLSLGALGGLLGSRLCGLSDRADHRCTGTTVRLGLLGAFSGAIIGGLIGGALRK